MNLLNTENFYNIVNYYKLNDFIDYYLLFNKSKYINSYHGYNHVKNIICSLQYALINNEFPESTYYETVQATMIAAIFHDFDYCGVDFTNKDYDKININSAISAFNKFLEFAPYKQKLLINADLVKQLISDTEYPACKEKELTPLSTLFVDCDHSMVIHNNYHIFGALFSVNECNILDKNEILYNAEKYLNNVKFNTKSFQEIWEVNSQQIRDTFKNFIISTNMEKIKYSPPDYLSDFTRVVPNFKIKNE